MTDLTESQEKALIEAVREHWVVSDAWDNILSDNDRKDAAAYFLAGVRWAQKEKR
jgi:hypothetical protein